jgi:hypothetical protein
MFEELRATSAATLEGSFSALANMNSFLPSMIRRWISI